MEQVALRLRKTDGWTYLGGKADARKPIEVVVRAFTGGVLAATGETDEAPDGAPVQIPEGQGRRLVGRHFFVRPAVAGTPCLLSHRGLE